MIFTRTVTGDCNPQELGFTHSHEHLFVFPCDYTTLSQRLILDDYEKTRDEVLRFKKLGGGTIVDVQPFGAGRHAIFLHRVSAETGVQIIAATGLHKSAFYQSHFWSYGASAEDIASLFISEIEEGMYEYDSKAPFRRRSNRKAGMIKIATEDDGVTPYYKKVFDAAVMAHLETGAPIMTHTELSQGGLEQAEYLIDHGISPHSIIISHMDRVIDIQRNIELARLGVSLEYDTIARFKYHSDKDEVYLIRAMIDHGFAHQILVGMDSTRERFLSYGGRFGLEYIQTTFIPLLRREGVTEEQIEMIAVRNPKRVLSFMKG